MAKTICSVSREMFHAEATPIKVTIDFGDDKKVVYELPPNEFSTGSLGYSLSGRFDFPIVKERTPCMLSLNLTLVGSKRIA